MFPHDHLPESANAHHVYQPQLNTLLTENLSSARLGSGGSELRRDSLPVHAFPSSTYVPAAANTEQPQPHDRMNAAVLDAIAAPPALPLLRAEVPLTDTLAVLEAVEEERKVLRHLQHLYRSELAKLQDDAGVLMRLLESTAPDSAQTRALRAQVDEAAAAGAGGAGAYLYREKERERKKTAADISIARTRAQRELTAAEEE